MIPLSEIISRVRTRHEQSSTTRWTDADITVAINEGLETLAEATHFYERYTTVPVQANRTWYDLRGFTPEVIVQIKSVWSTARNEFIEPISEERLYLDWEQATGEPVAFFTRGVHWLGVWPKLGDGSTGGYLRVYFSGIPPRYAFNQAVIRDLPDDYVPAIEDYALYEMSAADREFDKSLLYWKSYQEREKSFAGLMDRRLVSGRVSALGG